MFIYHSDKKLFIHFTYNIVCYIAFVFCGEYLLITIYLFINFSEKVVVAVIANYLFVL